MAQSQQPQRSGSNGALIVAALVLGASIVAASVLIRGALDRGAQELASVGVAVGELQEALQTAERPAAPPQPVARPDRPDPDKRYEVNTKGSPAIGPESAEITVVEFSDFQCPFCARVGPTLKQIEAEYGDRVRIVFKHLPLSIHPKAPAAHAAAEAAHRQGKFWEMHDKIFGNQREMSPERYVEWAGEIGLDVEKFKKDSAGAEVKKKIDQDTQDAANLQVRGTPGFFINGRYLSGAQPFEAFKRVIEEELQKG